MCVFLLPEKRNERDEEEVGRKKGEWGLLYMDHLGWAWGIIGPAGWALSPGLHPAIRVSVRIDY